MKQCNNVLWEDQEEENSTTTKTRSRIEKGCVLVFQLLSTKQTVFSLADPLILNFFYHTLSLLL